MKQFGIFLFGLSLALVTSCSKDEVEPIDNEETITQKASVELTGEFAGNWSCMGGSTSGKIMVSDCYIYIDELPTTRIVNDMRLDIEATISSNPGVKNLLNDSIGNFFFASSYNYPKTDLYINYQLESDSNADGVYKASISSVKNIWSDIYTTINTDYVPPYSGESTVIGPAEPNTISFGVEADGVPYRIDLVSKEQEYVAEFYTEPQLNTSSWMWELQFWFKSFRIVNLETGQKYNLRISALGPRYEQGLEDTLQLLFKATERTGDADILFLL